MIEATRRTSNPNALLLLFATVVGTLFSIGLTYSVLTTRGNSLSQLTLYLAVGGLIGGILNPRLMLFVFVVVTGYLDLLKRLLVLFEAPNMLDLFYVLGVAPLMMLGILLGVVLGGMLGRFKIEKRHLSLFAVATAVVLVTALFAFKSNGVVSGLRNISNGAAFAYMLFVLPVLFRSWQELWVLIRFVLIVFVPVGIYAIYQSIFGLSNFEHQYLESGLTIMVKELKDVRPRPFSTMNAAHTMAYMSSILMALSFIPFAAGKPFKHLFSHRWVYGLLIGFYFVVCFVTLVRSGHFIWFTAFAGMIAFFTAKRAVFFYSAAASGFLLMMTFSDWLLKKLPVWDAMLDKSSDFMYQATRIQTFNERLYSYAQLKKLENYSLFGLKHEVPYHDAITEALVNYGVVPLLIGVLILATQLGKIHKAIDKVVSVSNRKVAALFLAIAVSIIACDSFFGSCAKVYPISAYMWLALGGALVVIFYQQNEKSQQLPTDTQAAEKSRTTRQPATQSTSMPPIVPSGVAPTTLSLNASTRTPAIHS